VVDVFDRDWTLLPGDPAGESFPDPQPEACWTSSSRPLAAVANELSAGRSTMDITAVSGVK